MATDGKNLFAGTWWSGVMASSDTGRTWHTANEDLVASHHVLNLGVFDTVLFACVWEVPQEYYFTYARPIPEMVKDSTLRAVETSPHLKEDDILIYPNPVSGLVTIESSTGSIRSVTVLNLLGEAVLQAGNVGRDVRPTRLDMSKLPVGTYFLRIETERGTMVRKVVREK
jgi:hypothetical protein